ncbi:hypothetical protein D3C86_2001190 [compost metagenome]
MLACQLRRIGFVIAFELRYLRHKLGSHIHRNGQFAIDGLHAAIHFLCQRLRFTGRGGRIFQEQGQVEVGFAFAVFPAQWGDRDHRLAFQQQRQVA